MRARAGRGYHQRMTDTFTTPAPRTARLAIASDAVLAFGLLLVVWAGMWLPDVFVQAGRRFPQGMRPFEHSFVTPPLAFAVAALCILPLVLRRRFPVTVLVVVSAATVLYQVLGFMFPPSLVIAGVLVALYTAGTVLDRRRLALIAVPCAAAVVATSLPGWGSPMFWADLVRTIAVLAVAAALGDATRNRRAYIEEVEERASEAERTREEEARRRVDEERLRIARELHDVTAHSLSIVAVQSGVALHVLDTDPAAARTALTAIRETSRDSLNELRGMLGVLRSSGDAAGDAPLAPTPGLARLDDLIRPLRDAGLAVEVTGTPVGDPLPAIVDSSAYRIVQEALTNVLRHAGSASVVVRLERTDDALSVEVADDGSGSAARVEAEGHGIAGMRERALALGGTFEAGPRAGGGWRVAAVLPFTTRSS
jgi:signal transduction histidine kinase